MKLVSTFTIGLLLVGYGLISPCFSQTSVYDEFSVSRVLDPIWPGKRIGSIEYQKKLLGSIYLYDEWRLGTVYLLSDTIILKDITLMVNIKNDNLELLIEGYVRELPSYFINKIELAANKKTFISHAGLGLYGSKGFYRLLLDGRYKLYCHYAIEVLEANYNDALAAGRRDDKIVQVETYYMKLDEKLLKLEQRKSKLLEQLSDFQGLENHIKSNRINLKSEQGLIDIVKYIESLKN